MASSAISAAVSGCPVVSSRRFIPAASFPLLCLDELMVN
jgi:hypothetical protein